MLHLIRNGEGKMIRTAVTEYGTVKGLPADDPRVTVFKGIPFAKPPVGDLRWRAPEPPDKWEGVRECYSFAPACMQDAPSTDPNDLYAREFHVDPDIDISEDSLYLNVWTGAKSTSEKLPVLVWIYGGVFQWGYTSEMEFNGERLARHGIVVVSVAYRLGAFGFLAHPELTKENPASPTNFGFLDQQAGLEWVYRNIAAFGGDPDNITLGGQSAGGASVMSQLANPKSASMIGKVSIMSGLIRNPFAKDDIIQPKNIDTVYKNGEDFITFLGCSSVNEARKIDACSIRDAYAKYAKDHPRFVPCIDNVFIKKDPYEMLVSGELPDIPIFTGYTKDEFPAHLPTSADNNDVKAMADIYEKDGAKMFNIVCETVRRTSARLVENGMKSPVFTYRFEPSVPGDDGAGACHSFDLWFFFETLQKCWRPYNGMHYALARRMCDYWSNFIKNGDPNGEGYDGKKLPVWDPVSSSDSPRYEMIFRE